ncbi:hypothetical protein CPB84DRAFT_1007262 [Gymnopilus junonius]|uniref:Uncharacterized protein n=1 Tax=Gymnopilus junonius TaxID=109634 RepID=A0A9P5NL00_GYMJU|nr:hypothetical protein CPB84DRAFT_1007262 [Gymnopilus junonius]
MSIPWLAGIPIRYRALIWPSNDETILAGIWDREGTSILDGLILHWFAFTRNTKRTVVYLADTRPQGEEPIVLSPVEKELEFAADRIALVGSNEFSSAEWVESDEALKLRLHSLDGSLVRESSISVKAAYGDLRVFGPKVFIAISSGPTNAPEGSMTPDQLRLGSDPNDMDTSSPLFADQILEWDTTSCVFRRIKIPDPLYHGAEYTFPVEHQVALAGLVEDGDGREQLALTCFNADDQVQNQSVLRSFSPGGSSQERAIQGMSVGLEGNTKPSNVIVHSFDRIAMFNRTFFSEEMPVCPPSSSFQLVERDLPLYFSRPD